MNRNSLILSDYKYIVDLYDCDIDKIDYYKKFVFIRNFDYINNIAQDKDIYIIEKNLYLEYYNNNFDIIFPIYNVQNIGYSNNVENFTSFSNKEYYYEFLNENGEETMLKCTKIRIYHPTTKTNLNGIIHVHNYINGIHFHYLCNDLKMYNTNAETEIEIKNNKYSEYIEIYIPDIYSLFNDNEDTIFYKEDINVTYSVENEKFLNSKLKLVDNYQLIPFSLFMQPYRIIKEIDNENYNNIHYVKQFLKLRNSIENNYLTFSLNVSIFPYSYIDEYNEKYVYDENIISNTITFFKEHNIKLISNYDFDKNDLIIKSYVEYPHMDFFNKNYKDMAFYNGYKNLNNVTDDMYSKEDLDITYTITLYTDIKMKQYIYIKTKHFLLSDLKNEVIFKLNDIFNDWYEVPKMLYCIVTFKDNVLGLEFSSNKIVLNSEKIKYMILNDNIFLNKIINANRDMKEIKLSENNINFINNINCIINKETKEGNVINKTNTQRVIYKPIFYKVQDLQNIKLIKGISQNIGINLANYMTKVSSFKMIIDGNEIVESGRNDIFVIFKINTNNITNISGKYNISDISGEYISSGNYTLE